MYSSMPVLSSIGATAACQSEDTQKQNAPIVSQWNVAGRVVDVDRGHVAQFAGVCV